ncbi:MAG TPA: M28 family peptidase [Solimonas sp.]
MRLKTYLTAIAVAVLVAACGSSDRPSPGSPGVGGGLSAEPVMAPATAAPCARDTRAEAQGLPSTERIFGWIETLVGFGYRRTGTPAGYQASAFVKCQFEALGLENVHYLLADSWSWHAEHASLHVGNEPIDVFPMAHSFITPDEAKVFSTGPEGLNAELVDIGLGLVPGNLEGKIAVFDLKFLTPPALFALATEFIWDPTLSIVEPSFFVANPYQSTLANVANAVMDAGAVGFIGVLTDYFDSNQYYNEHYGSTKIKIPGLWVTRKEGERLRSLMAKQPDAKAKLVMEGVNRRAMSRSVVGFLPGKSTDTIMVQSHHDSVWDGAVEDASGTASVLAQAQYFASQPPESRQKTMMFVTFDSHFTGYQGHGEFFNQYIFNPDSPYKIVANVTLEHIAKQGVKGADDKLEITGQSELRGIFDTLGPTLKAVLIGAVIKNDLRRTAVLNAHPLCLSIGIPADSNGFCLQGIPTATLISGPNYLYDAEDTLDKVAQDQLVPVAKTFIEVIDAIDATPTPLIGIPIKSPLFNP